MKFTLITTALVAVLAASGAQAQQTVYTTPGGTPDGKVTVVVPENHVVVPSYVPPAAQDTVKGPVDLHNPNNIRFLSGGVGADEQAEMKAAEADYPLKVTFASPDGAFLSDVQVDIKDAKGIDILSLLTDGPILLVDLKPGSYTLTASNGSQMKEHSFTLKGKHAFAIHF